MFLISEWDVILRLGAALLIGGAVGFERSKQKKAAGMRTHALVCISSAMITIISAYGFAEFDGNRNMDPARLAVGIITGIGFLGAGLIWKQGSDIRGLTTAANIWAAGGLGIAVGLGHFFLATATVVFMQLALSLARLMNLLGIIRYDQPARPQHPADQD